MKSDWILSLWFLLRQMGKVKVGLSHSEHLESIGIDMYLTGIHQEVASSVLLKVDNRI